MAEVGLLGLGVSSVQGATLLVSMLAATKWSAGSYGALGLSLVTASYLSHLNGGVLNGANREIPRAAGRFPEEALRLEGLVITWTAITAPVVMLVGGALLWGVNLGTGIVAAGALFSGSWYAFVASQTLLRAKRLFGALSRGLILAGALVLLCGVASVFAGGPTWTLLALAGALWVPVLLWLSRFGRPVLFSQRDIARLIRVGAPIMANGFAFLVAQTANRWYLAASGGVELTAPMELAHRVLSVPLFGAQIVVERFYPYLAAAAGDADGDAVRRVHGQQLRWVFGFVVFIAVVLGVLGTWYGRLVPNLYLITTLAFAPGMAACTVILVASTTLTAIAKERTALAVQTAGVMFQLVLMHSVTTSRGLSAVAVAGSSSAALVVVAAVLVMCVRRSMISPARGALA